MRISRRMSDGVQAAQPPADCAGPARVTRRAALRGVPRGVCSGGTLGAAAAAVTAVSWTVCDKGNHGSRVTETGPVYSARCSLWACTNGCGAAGSWCVFGTVCCLQHSSQPASWRLDEEPLYPYPSVPALCQHYPSICDYPSIPAWHGLACGPAAIGSVALGQARWVLQGRVHSREAGAATPGSICRQQGHRWTLSY